MFNSLPAWLLVLIFMIAIAIAIVWGAGMWLSDTTDIISERFHLGQAMGGIILLAIGTNLPEIAITASAALQHNIGIAIGNLLGGIAIQTVVLVALDAALRGEKPLMNRAASLVLVLEAALVIVVLTISILGTRLPASLVLWRITPQNLLILLAWLGGLWILKNAPKQMTWQLKSTHSDQAAPEGQSQKQESASVGSTTRVLIKFGVACLATLGAGIALEESGDALATHLGMSGVLFGATALAASTSVPELAQELPRSEWEPIGLRFRTSSEAMRFSLSCSCWEAFFQERLCCPTRKTRMCIWLAWASSLPPSTSSALS